METGLGLVAIRAIGLVLSPVFHKEESDMLSTAHVRSLSLSSCTISRVVKYVKHSTPWRSFDVLFLCP